MALEDAEATKLAYGESCMDFKVGPESTPARRWLAVLFIALCCVALIGALRLPGLFVSLILVALAYLLFQSRPDNTEQNTIRTSIDLSVEDITDVLESYEKFVNCPDADCIADRTLHRPALLDEDCQDPAITEFFNQHDSNKRFLRRLNARLAKPQLEVSELELLLKVTDKRAAALKESWLLARQAAARLGPDYRRS